MSEFWNFSEAINERILTISGFEFGTSIPIVPFPGMGAIIRMPSALKLSAISSSRFLILSFNDKYYCKSDKDLRWLRYLPTNQMHETFPCSTLRILPMYKK